MSEIKKQLEQEKEQTIQSVFKSHLNCENSSEKLQNQTVLSETSNQIYDFDTVIERRGSECMKFDQISNFELYKGQERETDAMWVADTDFAVCTEIVQELKTRCDHPIFGYPTELKDEELLDAIHDWFKRRHNMKFENKDIVHSIGALSMIVALMQVLTNPGDGVISLQFIKKTRQNKRVLVPCSLLIKENKYEIDFDELEKLMSEAKNRMFILSNPHNPTGRVWTREEMQRISQLCVKHDVFLLSDEIFSDLTFSKYTHTSPLALDYEPIQNKCAVLATPSKCFGLAGLTSSTAIIKSDVIRQQYIQQIQSMGLYFINIFGQVAIKAAYQKGENWIGQARDYMERNFRFVQDFFEKNDKRVKILDNQAGYLVMISFEELGLTQDELKIKLANVNVLPTYTTDFYEPPTKRAEIRLNIGCSKIVVERVLNQILKAIQ